MTDTTNTDIDYEGDSKKPLKEIPIVQDHGFFIHSTGDKYDGFFEAKKKDRSVRMNGPGIYTTSEGDEYTAVWEADKLGGVEETTICYIDNAKFEGRIKDWCYSGRGKYFYPDGSILACDFVENCPNGALSLIDPNEHIWLGTCKAEHGFGWCEPVNHFYEHLEKTCELKRVRHKHRKIQEKEL